MPTLSDRIHDVPPCSQCRPSGGIWACDEKGDPRLGARCGCLKGRLLAKADAGRARRLGFSVPLYEAIPERRCAEGR
jgi:hypothetical protein